jgi:uncharacterized protein YjeT (DUF2065 family)
VDSKEILTAVALLLVLEGMLPFIGPDLYRQAVARIARLSDNQLRTIGLTVMITGLLMLFIVRN